MLGNFSSSLDESILQDALISFLCLFDCSVKFLKLLVRYVIVC